MKNSPYVIAPRKGQDDGELTVACVYRTGGRCYDTSYVAVLRDMVRRHLSLPHRFICLTDEPQVPCERIPLVTDWRGFYSKIELFRPGLFSGPVLYLDLDTVIHRSIDDLAQMAGRFAFGCVSDPLGGHMNSSVLTFTIDCSFIFERFRSLGFFDRHVRPHLWFAAQKAGVAPLERRLRMGSSYGDQGFSEMCLGEAGVPVTHLDHLRPDLFSTFNFTADARQEPDGHVCLMMGRPKPHEVRSGWVADHWCTGARGAVPAAVRT